MAELDQLDPPKAGKAGIQAALNKVATNTSTIRTFSPPWIAVSTAGRSRSR